MITKEQILNAYKNGRFKPILIYKDNKIRNGHFRYALFKKAGLESIPVTYDQAEQENSLSHDWYYEEVKNNRGQDP